MCLVMYICLTPFYLHQKNEDKVPALESKLAELKAENQPVGLILKQTIYALGVEEVGFVWMPQSFPFLEISCFVCVS